MEIVLAVAAVVALGLIGWMSERLFGSGDGDGDSSGGAGHGDSSGGEGDGGGDGE